MIWTLVKTPEGARFLLHLDQCVGMAETKEGMAVMVAQGGGQVPLGNTFDEMMADLCPDELTAEEVAGHG